MTMTKHARFLLPAALLLWGCNDGSLTGRIGDVEVSPSSVVFAPGETGPDGGWASRTVVIANRGGGPIEIHGIALEDGTTAEGGAFAWEGPDASFRLDPGQEIAAQVFFAPPADGGARSGALRVRSDDPDEPVVTVALSSGAGAPPLRCAPQPVALASIPGQTAVRDVVCTNEGETALAVTGVELAPGSAGELSLSGIAAPLSLSGGDSTVLFRVEYAPMAEGTHAGEVEVHTDASEVPLRVDVNGLSTAAPSCQLEAWPAFVPFGVTHVGQPGSANVQVGNAGGASCEAVISIAGDGFSAPGGPVTLAPGASHSVTVTFAPSQRGPHEGTLLVENTDPGQSALQVPLQGQAIAPELELQPCPLSFGTVKTGCSAMRTLVIQNAGDAPLQIGSVSLDAGTAEFSHHAGPTSGTIGPGAQAALTFRFAPAGEGARARMLTISSNDADEPVVQCALLGDALAADQAVDTHVQQTVKRADVLFVVDNSGSMAEEQATLAASFPDFVDALVADGVDFHLGVVTTDDDQLQGSPKVVTPATPDPAGTFAQNATVGTAGYGFEQPFLSARYALSPGALSGVNAGFLRGPARLFLVFVGDEDDQSSGSVSFYASTFEAVKSTPSMVAAYAIGGPLDGSCATAWPGTRLAAMAGMLGGQFGSICASNFAGVLEEIADAASELPDEFPLSRAPVVSTLQITVDGVPQPSSAWSYASAPNTVVFAAGSVPPAGSTVTIAYDVVCQ